MSTAIEVQPGRRVFQIRTSMPFPLKTSNGYLGEGKEGWTVIDGGVNTPANRDLWEQALREIGIRFKDIKAIYVTHFHHDHLGLAGWMQRMTSAPVYMSNIDLTTVNRLIRPLDKDHYLKEILPLCRLQGWDDRLALELAADVETISPLITPLPELCPIEAGHRFSMGEETFTTVLVPGHSDGHLVFLGDKGSLFSGDTLLASYNLHATDWPHTTITDPLSRFLEALSFMKHAEIKEAYPGHGSKFGGFRERLAEIMGYHHRRLLEVLKALDSPKTAWQLACQIAPPADYIHIKRLVLAETLAYLQYLEKHLLISSFCQTAVVFYPLPGKASELCLSELMHKR